LDMESPRIFSYPHGLPAAPEILHEYGFTHAVTAGKERAVQENDISLLIPRIEGSSIQDFIKN